MRHPVEALDGAAELKDIVGTAILGGVGVFEAEDFMGVGVCVADVDSIGIEQYP